MGLWSRSTDASGAEATNAPSVPSVPSLLLGRFPIASVSPSSLDGRRPAAAVVGEAVPIVVTAFREGHDAMGVTVVLRRPDGSAAQRVRLKDEGTGLDTWRGLVRPDAMGDWTFDIEAWGSPYDTWCHRAEIKVAADVDVELELTEGSLLLAQAAQARAGADRATLTQAAALLADTSLPAEVRLMAGTDSQVHDLLYADPIRTGVTVSAGWPLRVQRRRALVGAWYEFFPRSEGAAPPATGTLLTAMARLDKVAANGFDVVYLPPIHPIGTVNRKGRNNTLTPDPDDVGSPWAIGSADGGHDAVHPDLGTMADLDAFVARAASLGMEIALDLALQAAPDHPWVSAHPEWFTTRADGTIAYAENPPKKYQDIYPLNFDNDPEGLYAEIERVVRLWMAHGIRIFRVDNPHTKPLWVWDRLLASIWATDPDVLFLAEAFTRPPMMQALAEVGFQQSYTYFTWRNGRDELAEYATELARVRSAYMRPNFFANTPDILTEYLQESGPAGFGIRATLAATLSPTYGIYSGFELYEHEPVRPGSEEYRDSEKYQLRPRDWSTDEGTLTPHLALLNEIRRAHPALQDLRSLTFHRSEGEGIIAFSKRDGDDLILVACLTDPSDHESTIAWDMPALGLDWSDTMAATDLLTGTTYSWGARTYVRLSPQTAVAHIVHVSPTSAAARA